MVTMDMIGFQVEEAERRRLADQTGRERLQKLQSRQAQLAQAAQQYPQYRSGLDHPESPTHSAQYAKPHQYDLSVNEPSATRLSPNAAALYGPPPSQQGPHMGAPPVTHVMEHVERPEAGDRSRPSRPIPDSIKQTLINRVTSPTKSPCGPSYSPPDPRTGPPSYTPPEAQPSQYGPYSTGSSGGPYRSPTSPQQAPSSQYNSHSPYAQPHVHAPYSHPQSNYENTVPYRYQDQVPYTGGYNQPAGSYPDPRLAYQDPRSAGYPAGGDPRLSQSAPAKPPRSQRDDPAPRAEQVIVNGRQNCSHCERELGKPHVNV